MNNYNFNKKNSTITTQVMCAIVFCLFSFCWLYWFQADVLAVAQHILSGGATSYHRTASAILITLVLCIVQRVVLMFTHLYRRTHALTYLPSLLILAAISNVDVDIDKSLSFGAWYIVFPTVLLSWGGVVWLARQMMPFQSDKESTGLFSRRVWQNMLTMAVMMFAVAMIGNSNAVFHYRAHMEVALQEKRIDDALRTGKQSAESNAHLTMLRAYALSLKGEMAERLFEYPVAGCGDDLLPLPTSHSRLLLLNADTLFAHLGAKPHGQMKASRYYDLLERDTLATAAVADYRLCSMLIDKRIDDFARTLPRYYAVNDSLPKYYKEALTLYVHQRSNPVVVFHNTVLDEDWADFQHLQAEYEDKNERKGQVNKNYATSYWRYYYYN